MLRFIPVFFALMALAADWPQWRGPARNGISQETGLLAEWPSGGPPLVWRAQGLGNGYSGPTIAGSRLYVQGQQGGQQYVLAMDVASGKSLWKTSTGPAYSNDRGDGPRGSATIDGNRLYALSGNGTLVCLDPATGKKVWEINILQKFGGRNPHWGISESPLLDGNRLIVTPGGSGASVVALDKANGNLLWKSQSEPAAYSSPMPFEVGGTRGVVVLTAKGALGLKIDNGELLWRYDRISNRVANIATPIVHQGHVFLSTDYGTGCALLKLEPSGGSVQAKEVYFNNDMRNHYNTSVLLGDTLYGYSSQILVAMKWATGKVAWRDRAVGKGSCIYADKRLYCLGEGGTVGLIDPSPKAYQEVSRFQISKGDLPAWTPLVIANGRLYLRDQDNLYSYNIRAAK